MCPDSETATYSNLPTCPKKSHTKTGSCDQKRERKVDIHSIQFKVTDADAIMGGVKLNEQGDCV